jgi:hypothetical protein
MRGGVGRKIQRISVQQLGTAGKPRNTAKGVKYEETS